jgi:flagellar hook protein FlgE
MMRSLFSGVSGLRNHQTRMDVIGNNIANVNTVGFKGSRVQFQDVLSQTITGAASAQGNRGGTNPMQVGLGMGLASIDTIFTDGSFQPTGKGTDLSIQGAGFFILGNGDQQIFTRAGNFDFDTDGNYLVPGTGYKVMGWMADATGTINTAGNVAPIKIPVGASMPALASTEITYANNLSADVKTNTSVETARDVFDSLGNSHEVKQTLTKVGPNAWIGVASVADAVTGTVTNTTRLLRFNPTNGTLVNVHNATLSTTIPSTNVVFQSLDLNGAVAGGVNNGSISVREPGGGFRSFNITYTQTGANAWDYTITDPTGAALTDATGSIVRGGGPAPAPYTYTFTNDNATPAPTFTYTATDGSSRTVTFGAAGVVNGTGTNTFACEALPLTDGGTATNLNFTPNGGATAMSVELDMSTLTQFGGSSTVQATGQNGYAAGTLDTTSIDPSGIIVGKFTNGQSQNLGQVALATFNNPAGLNKVGENLFAESNNSGVAQIGESGTGGRGKFNPGTLEMANVDLANEFSNMIITQRGFQANSKIITVTDEMLQELANLKR